MATAPVTTTTTLTGVLTDQSGATFNVTLTSTPKAVTPPPPPPSSKESPNLTFITKPGDTLIDATGGTWTITTGLQLARNGTTDTTTANVVGVGISSHVIYQTNKDGGWWSGTPGKWTDATNPGFKNVAPPVVTPPSPPVVTQPVAAGIFTVSQANGIRDGAGNRWELRGYNCQTGQEYQNIKASLISQFSRR